MRSLRQCTVFVCDSMATHEANHENHRKNEEKSKKAKHTEFGNYRAEGALSMRAPENIVENMSVLKTKK